MERSGIILGSDIGLHVLEEKPVCSLTLTTNGWSNSVFARKILNQQHIQHNNII